MFTIENHDSSLVLSAGSRRLRIAFVTETIVRLTFTAGKPFQTRASLNVEPLRSLAAFELQETEDDYIVSTDALKLVVCKQSAAIRYYDRHDKLLVCEPAGGGKWLAPKEVYKNVYDKDANVAANHSVDGVRASASAYDRVFDRTAFEAKLEFVFAEHEALFGLGSHEEGYGNLRGKSRELYQHNLKAAVPYFVSTKGYGVLLYIAS